jgi:hypothetical protein
VLNPRSFAQGLVFTAALVIAGGCLCFDIFFRASPPHALMNVEAIVALSFLGLLWARSGKSEMIGTRRRHSILPSGAIILAIALAFFPILQTPFLYDDYTHIADASRFTLRTVARQFGQVPGQGLFFRPLGFLLYWLNYLWVGANPTLWHAGNIAMHAACACLMFVLCRELGLTRQASLAGALLFGLSGVSAESVAWIDAGFVILTTALVLLSLIGVCRYAAMGRKRWLSAALIFGACAMLCKETAFCLPLLIATLALFRDRRDWNRIGRAAILSGVLTLLLFLYRWWALKGIGGYAGTQFNLFHTMEALFLRQWAVLSFPLNWSVSAGPILRIALVAIPLLLAAFAWMAKPRRRPLIGCVLFIVASAMPVEHLLLISVDLGGSRTLYLGSVGWALLFAMVFESMRPSPRVIAACVLVIIQVLMLEHNLAIWRDTAEMARSVCANFGQTIAGMSGGVVVLDLPATRDGTVFLQNGFPQCVQMNTGVPASRIQTQPEPDTAGFMWDSAHDRIEEAAPR